MSVVQHPAVKAFEDRKRAAARELLLSKNEFSFKDVPAGYVMDFFSYQTWEDSFSKNPVKASKNLRKVLLLTTNAGVSEASERSSYALEAVAEAPYPTAKQIPSVFTVEERSEWKEQLHLAGKRKTSASDREAIIKGFRDIVRGYAAARKAEGH